MNYIVTLFPTSCPNDSQYVEVLVDNKSVHVIPYACRVFSYADFGDSLTPEDYHSMSFSYTDLEWIRFNRNFVYTSFTSKDSCISFLQDFMKDSEKCDYNSSSKEQFTRLMSRL